VKAGWLALAMPSQTWQAIGSLARPRSGGARPGGCFRKDADGDIV
jgi:hypothetical protein